MGSMQGQSVQLKTFKTPEAQMKNIEGNATYLTD